MILCIHSDASYLSVTKSSSRASGVFFLSDPKPDTITFSAEPEDDTPLLPEERFKFIQQVVGVFLYYAIAIDNTILVVLSDIGSEQARATSKTMDEVQQLLNYLASNPKLTM